MKKIATIFAGAEGCGKTTLYYNELEKSKDFGLRINIKGGHDIKEELIEKRYHESLKNFNIIAKFCNHITIFDNTQNYKKLLEFKNNKLEVFEITKWLEPLMINFKSKNL